MMRVAFALALIAGCSPAVTPAATEPVVVESPAPVPQAPVAVVEPPVVLAPIFTDPVPDGPLRAVYGVYVDIEDLSPPLLSKADRARWEAARAVIRDVRSEADARARWLTARFLKALAKHQAKCMRDGSKADSSCDADLVMCGQDNFVPSTITTTKADAKTARVVVEDERHTVAVSLVHEPAGWRIDGVGCTRR